MIISDIISITLLSVLLFWTVYNGSIIYMGIRGKRKHQSILSSTINGELPKFSIIVPTKNEENVIRRCLDGIFSIDYPKNKMQIIVVDGKSSDDTGKICSEFSEKYPENIQFICEKTVKGKPAALNLALPYIKGDIVGVFDADSLPEKDVLSKVASYFNDKKIMALQGRTTSINEKNNALTRVIAMEEKAWFQALLDRKRKTSIIRSAYWKLPIRPNQHT